MSETIKPLIESVDGIIKTEAITFPRSGHHLLKNILEHYFDGSLHHCSVHEDPADLRLGVHPLTNFQKNHDFELDTDIAYDRKYLVQVRNPIDAVESWIRLIQRVGTGEPILPDYTVWQLVSLSKLRYWINFVEKWVYTFVPNRLVVSYHDLLNRPESAVTSVIQHLRGKAEVNGSRLAEALNKYPPRPQLTGGPAFYERA